jgi:acetate kinase
MKVLTINSGSSSLKFQLFDMATSTMLAKGLIERINSPQTRLVYSNGNGQTIEKKIVANSYEAAISEACILLQDKNIGVIENLAEIQGIGHRVVHGGAEATESSRINARVKQIIRDNAELAPIHNPPNLESIEACESLFSDIPMVAVFDTAFHQSMPPAAYTYAIPADVAAKHKIRRYGFHGTSHQYVAHSTADLLGRPLDELKLITVHLGNGCSMAAINKGRVEDTSMGMTPLEGLVMGTRSGDIDPGIIFYLRRLGYSMESIDTLLNKSSGIMGLVSTGSNDMRDLIVAVGEGLESAILTLNVFVHRLVKYIGAYAAVLNGFDALVFTAGIGENVPPVRARVCEHLTYLGIRIDAARNRGNELFLTEPGAMPAVMVVPTNEELMIARETVRLLNHH